MASSHGQRRGHSIIIISGDKSAKDRKNALATGAVEFFPKPIDRIALLATIRATLGEDAAGEAPGPA